ncbi:MAG: GNAT family N-acetyltransferase [Gemmatimonadaceae bacterium]
MRSEFYDQRRTSIKDGVGLVAFIFGWFAAAPFAWPYIAAGFEDNGNAASGVLRFFLVVFAVGVASGALGLALGHASGWAWETLHRRSRRGFQSHDEHAPAPALVAAAGGERSTLPVLRYGNDVAADDYLALLALAGMPVRDTRGTSEALARSTVIGAWEGERLVGLARVLSDGHLAASLADLAVDPAYQRRGVGRELVRRALDTTPRGSMSIVAPRGTGGFFEKVGCERALAAFTLHSLSS